MLNSPAQAACQPLIPTQVSEFKWADLAVPPFRKGGSCQATTQRPSPLRGHTSKSNEMILSQPFNSHSSTWFSFPFTRAAVGCDWRGQPAMDGRLKLARQEAAQADPGRRARQRNQACVGRPFLGSVFWTSKKWNSRCARMDRKNRSIEERETHTTSLDMNAEDNKRKIRFVGLNTWKARWHCFVANQALLLPPRLSATAPSTFLSTATKRYQKMPPQFPAVSCASRPSRGSADTSLRDGRRRPSMACPFGLIPAEPAMLGRAKGYRWLPDDKFGGKLLGS